MKRKSGRKINLEKKVIEMVTFFSSFQVPRNKKGNLSGT